MKKKLTAIILAMCMMTCIALVGMTVSAASADVTAVAEDYGLPTDIEDGNILHCFDWTLTQIKEALPQIAAAGFKSVQTSPLQRHSGSGSWYWLYQPTGFTLGNEIGSLSDLKSLCTEADKYGIKIIVDVVANHLAGSGDSLSSAIESDLRNTAYFHNEGTCTDYNNRYDTTHKNIGMPDLKSELPFIQNKVLAYINALKDAGADGIRWDAAKHIGLPSEDCDFWQVVTDTGLYNYGEILEGPAGSSSPAINDPLMKEYTEYMDVTDDNYSATVTRGFRDGSVAKSKGYWTTRDIAAGKLIYWGESHDTFSNTTDSTGWTKNLDQNVIDRAYAILAARADAQALYFSRPSSTNFFSITAASKGSTHFTSVEVAAVNRFHNAMAGTKDAAGTGSGCYIVCREGGAVIAAATGSDKDVTMTNINSMVPAGTYTDEISGSTWTVTADTISGHIGSTGIVVIYDEDYADKELLIGDADLSGEITILDATTIQRHLASLGTLTGTALDAADADRDGSVTILDATLIQRYLVGLKEDDCRIGEPLT